MLYKRVISGLLFLPVFYLVTWKLPPLYFTALIFNVAGGLAIFKLRRDRPDAPRPYRAWGYPVVPAIFVGATDVLLVNTLLERPKESMLGLAIVALGIPIYMYRRR